MDKKMNIIILKYNKIIIKMKDLIYYFNEFEIDEYIVIVEFDILLNKEKQEIFIDKIIYTININNLYKEEKELTYNINLTLKLD